MVVTVRVTLQLQRAQAAAISDSTAITRYLRIAQPPLLVADLVSGHELGHEESTQGVVLLLGVEANLSSGTLGGVGHLGLGVIACVTEQITLRQHAGSDGGAGIAQLRDVRLVGQAVDAEIDVGVATGFAMDCGHGILEFYSFHNS